MKAATKKPCSKRVVRALTDASIHDVLTGIGSPRALAVWLLYSSGEHDQLLQLECKPDLYLDHVRFRDDYTATNLLSKATFLRTSFDRERLALEKFSKAEDACRATNDRVWPFSTADYKPACELHPLIPRVRSKIKAILGRFDPLELVEWSDWGPGVSTLLKGPTSVKPNKYQQETGMTQEVFDTVWPLLHVAYPSWWTEILAVAEPSIQAGNVITTVPKNSKIDRVIAIEPGLNLFFQKGLGTMIRHRLLRFGCNLNDQGINARLSSRAHLLGLATVDFSSASDTIAYEVVRLLLPPEWFRVLKLFRCRSGLMPNGTPLIWQKFSSMGNGFTFELESLIFLAIALTASESVGEYDNISVFGDDVILPAIAYPTFLELVSLLGFTINQRKSFTSGWFYESCGAHWFQGFDVKPFYIEDMVERPAHVYKLHNQVIGYAARCLHSFGLDARFKRTCRNLRASVSPEDFLLVPAHFGDAGFWSNLDHAQSLATTSYKRGSAGRSGSVPK